MRIERRQENEFFTIRAFGVKVLFSTTPYAAVDLLHQFSQRLILRCFVGFHMGEEATFGFRQIRYVILLTMITMSLLIILIGFRDLGFLCDDLKSWFLMVAVNLLIFNVLGWIQVQSRCNRGNPLADPDTQNISPLCMIKVIAQNIIFTIFS